MWVFRRRVWDGIDVTSNGMGFSQELKNEAFARGYRCGEVPIEYRPRGGEKKLRTVRDGARNAYELVSHRLRTTCSPLPTVIDLVPVTAGKETVIDLREPAPMLVGVAD
jgi:hypothetical protein